MIDSLMGLIAFMERTVEEEMGHIQYIFCYGGDNNFNDRFPDSHPFDNKLKNIDIPEEFKSRFWPIIKSLQDVYDLAIADNFELAMANLHIIKDQLHTLALDASASMTLGPYAKSVVYDIDIDTSNRFNSGSMSNEDKEEVDRIAEPSFIGTIHNALNALQQCRTIQACIRDSNTQRFITILNQLIPNLKNILSFVTDNAEEYERAADPEDEYTSRCLDISYLKDDVSELMLKFMGRSIPKLNEADIRRAYVLTRGISQVLLDNVIARSRTIICKCNDANFCRHISEWSDVAEHLSGIPTDVFDKNTVSDIQAAANAIFDVANSNKAHQDDETSRDMMDVLLRGSLILSGIVSMAETNLFFIYNNWDGVSQCISQIRADILDIFN